MKKKIEIHSVEELGKAAQEFISQTSAHRLIAFDAPMGAGKTTFIKAICEALGVDGSEIASPTFSIVNEYLCKNTGESIYHFDFYRITKDEEALDIGLYDYLDSGCRCLMEWPENISGLLPDDTLYVSIFVQDDLSRVVTWDD